MLKFKVRSKVKWLVVLAAVLIISVAAISSTAGTSAEIYKVSRGEIRQYVEETAEVMVDQKQIAYIEGSGKIVKINVDVGDTVKKGDILLSLDKSELELELKGAQARVEASKAQLKGTELINYANKIEMAKASLNQAQIAYTSTARNYENSKSLYESNAISKDEFDKVSDQYKAAQAALNTANLQLSDIRKGAPQYVISGYEAQLEQAVINRDAVQKSIQRQDLKADIDGVVLEKHIDVNSIATPAIKAFVIGSVNNLKLEADILADDANSIKTGNEVEISGKLLGDAALKGKVIKIAPAAKTIVSNLGVNQKRVPVTIEITDKTTALKPGYNVDVKIITDARKDIITVPDSAVFEYGGKDHVFVVEKGKAVLREIKKGIENSSYIEVSEGLKEGDTILTKPDNSIKEGAKIKPLEKM